MGWKASCILINEREPGFLGTRPPHDPERARRLISRCGFGLAQSCGPTTFEEGIFPDRLVVGAYDGAAFLGDPDIGCTCLDPRGNPRLPAIVQAFPKAEILQVALHSVVNLWSYTYYVDGVLKRAFGGCADEGVMIDIGEPLPEERPHFERSILRDGERIFHAKIDGRIEEFDAASYGEELVFELMGRFGCRPDRDVPGNDPLDLPMEAFAQPRSRRWWWPFSRESV